MSSRSTLLIQRSWKPVCIALLGKILLAIGAVTLSLLNLSCVQTLAGTSVVGNPDKAVAIVITDPFGGAVSGIAVRMVPPDFDPTSEVQGLGKQLAAPSPRDTTDSLGRATILVPDTGTYNLISSAPNFKYRLYVQGVHVMRDTALDAVPLRAPGLLLVNIDSSVFIPDGKLVVEGTEIIIPVSSPGITALPVPAGAVTIRYTDSLGAPVAGALLTSHVVVTENDTLDLSGLPEIISTPLTPSGPTTGALSTEYHFTSGGALSNKGHAIQYRFDWGDTVNVSAWSSSTFASTHFQHAGTYLIRAQARSAHDTTVISALSSALAIVIY